MSRKLHWGGVPDLPAPKNPYRDTLLVYGGLSLVIVIIAWATGGSVGKAAVVAVLFFGVASGWTMSRFRARARAEAARRAEGESQSAARTARRRDAAGAVRQAGGGVPDDTERPPRPDRELAARAQVGDLGRVQAPRGGGADDVRPDDGRLVDL